MQESTLGHNFSEIIFSLIFLLDIGNDNFSFHMHLSNKMTVNLNVFCFSHDIKDYQQYKLQDVTLHCQRVLKYIFF